MADGVMFVSGATLGMAVVLVVMLGKAMDRLGRVERKIDLLLRHSGIDVAVLADHKAAELLRAGKTIQAIRLYRDVTGAGLAEARQHSEELRRVGGVRSAPGSADEAPK